MAHEPTDICIDLQPRLAAYALGEADAERDLLEHLRVCSSCRDDLRGYADVARVLPYAAPDVAPPPALRARVLAAVEQDTAPRRAPAPARAPRPRARPRFGLAWPAFGVAFAACIALLLWNLSLAGQLRDLRGQLAAFETQAQTNRESWATMVSLLNNPNVRWYPLNGSATAHFWAAPGGDVGCLVAENLPPLESGKVYQVWLGHGGRMVSGGTFEPRGNGGWVLVRADEPLSEYDEVAVTVEPHGGSSAPTGPPIVFGRIGAEGVSG